MAQPAEPYLPLPTTLDAITARWLTAALAHPHPGVVVERAEQVDIQHGTCTKLRLRLGLNPAGRAAGIPELVILKGGFEPHSRAMHYMHGHEVHAYADVAPRSPLRVPRSWFAAYDEAARQGIIIMEDLVARGVRLCHPQRPLSPEAVAQRLSALAGHHAVSWGADMFAPGRPFAWANGLIEGFDRYGRELLTAKVWQGYVESARGAAASTRFHALGWMKAALGAMLALSHEVPRVLLHGDTHLGNCYEDIDGTPGFFDSQPHYGPALAEVAYHVTGALDAADRRAHERALVAHYCAEIARHGIRPPDLDEAMRQFGAFLAVGYCIFLVNAADFQPEAINTAYTARFSQAMLDHGTSALLGLDQLFFDTRV